MFKGFCLPLAFGYFIFSNLYWCHNVRVQVRKLRHDKITGLGQDFCELGTFHSALGPLRCLTAHSPLGGFPLLPAPESIRTPPSSPPRVMLIPSAPGPSGPAFPLTSSSLKELFCPPPSEARPQNSLVGTPHGHAGNRAKC